ncbi:uncharacterized protein LOC135837343 [Planococcus citri]|uniref:uncharacterized protein LOC135837343 n=1 Tax=Planococcus citri TaxID=170843 RepID=UPI0031F7E103
MDLTLEEIEQLRRDSEELKRLKKQQKEAADETKSDRRPSSSSQLTATSSPSSSNVTLSLSTMTRPDRDIAEQQQKKSTDEAESDRSSSNIVTPSTLYEVCRIWGETMGVQIAKAFANALGDGDPDRRSDDESKVETHGDVYESMLEFQHRSFSLNKRISDATEAKLTFNIPKSRSLIIIKEPKFRKKNVEPEDFYRLTPDMFAFAKVKPWIGSSDYRMPEEFLKEFVFRIKPWCENNWMLNQAFMDLLHGEDFETESFKGRVNCNESFRLTAVAFITKFSKPIVYNSDLNMFANESLGQELKASEFVAFWLRRFQYNPNADPNWVMTKMAAKLPEFRSVFKNLKDDATVDDIIEEVCDFERDDEYYTISFSSCYEQIREQYL